MPTIEYDPAVGLREVIVLSSDDEDDSPSRELAERQNRKIRSLLQEVGKLRREKARAKANLAAAYAGAQVNQVKINEIAECVTCRICLEPLKLPHTLECGHVFCKGCLETTFDKKLAEHKKGHATYELRPSAVKDELSSLSNPNLTIFEEILIRRRLRDWLESYALTGPMYSCPVCRARVLGAPVECYALKNIVYCTNGIPQEDFAEGDEEGTCWDKFFLTVPPLL